MGVSLSTSARDLIRSGLFGKDFDTYRTEIQDYITATFGPDVGGSIIASKQGTVLIEMVAFALSTASWYGDRQADDTTLRDVRLRESAVVIARQLGYIPSAAVSATTDITVTIVSPTVLPADLIIEKGKQLTDSNGSIWEVSNTVVFSAGGPLQQNIAIREGQSLEEVFTSNGDVNQIFELGTIPDGKSIAQSSVTVTVNGIEWTVVPITTYDQINQVEVGYGFNPPRIIFGDGDAGNIPPKDSEIRVRYFATSGTGGSITDSSITQFNEPLVVGTTPVVTTIAQPNASTSGSNPESIDKIKASAPLVYQSAKRAVTLADLTGWINSYVDPVYGAVAKGRANTPRSTAADAEALTIISLVDSLATQLATVQPLAASSAASVTTRLQTYWDKVLASNCKANVVVAQILSADSTGRYIKASSGLASSLEAFLDDMVGSTVKLKVTDGSINLFSVSLTVNATLLSTYNNQTSKELIKNTIRTSLQSTLVNRDYGQSLRIGDLYDIIESIQGVDYAHVDIVVKDSFGNVVTNSKVNSYNDVVVSTYEVLTMGDFPVVTVG